MSAASEVAEALDHFDGWMLYAQWADNITVEEASERWDAMSPADRGEWHRRALPFSEIAEKAASLLRSQAAQIEAKDKALEVPAVWTEAETAALDAAYDRASRKHGWTETMYAIAAESLRLAAIRAARTAKDGQ